MRLALQLGSGAAKDAFPGAAPCLEDDMLGWAVTFLVIALIAALLGFSGLAAAASNIAQVLFVVFLVLFVVALFANAVRGRPPL